jgi:hypothetical protein
MSLMADKNGLTMWRLSCAAGRTGCCAQSKHTPPLSCKSNQPRFLIKSVSESSKRNIISAEMPEGTGWSLVTNSGLSL